MVCGWVVAGSTLLKVNFSLLSMYLPDLNLNDIIRKLDQVTRKDIYFRKEDKYPINCQPAASTEDVKSLRRKGAVG